MTTHLADQHRDDLGALRRVLPRAAGTLRAYADERINDTELYQLAEALLETCEILSDMGIEEPTTVPVDAAVAYLTYRGRLNAAIRRFCPRADGQVPA